MNQKRWNLVTVAALAALAAGLLLTRSVPLAGRLLLIAGTIAFLASMIGSRRSAKAYSCPLCGGRLRPMGRYFPGLPQTSFFHCTHCGASFPLEELERNEDSQNLHS